MSAGVQVTLEFSDLNSHFRSLHLQKRFQWRDSLCSILKCILLRPYLGLILLAIQTSLRWNRVLLKWILNCFFQYDLNVDLKFKIIMIKLQIIFVFFLSIFCFEDS